MAAVEVKVCLLLVAMEMKTLYQREQMDKDVHNLLTVKNELKNGRPVSRLLDSPFPAEKISAHNF